MQKNAAHVQMSYNITLSHYSDNKA